MTTYYLDPINGDDGYEGDSFEAGHPWKTLQHDFAAGDHIKIAKSEETVLPVTISGTQGNEVLNTTADLTSYLAQYSFIRIGGEDILYMVWAVTSSTIVLHRAYRGASGSGKTIYKLTPIPRVTTNDWKRTSGDGEAGNLIHAEGGYNTTSGVRDGFTVIDWNGSSTRLFQGTMYYWRYSNIYSYYHYGMWTYLNNCLISKCGSFRRSAYDDFDRFYDSLIEGYVTQTMQMGDMQRAIINDLETGDPTGVSALILNGDNYDLILNNWRNAGWHSGGGQALGFNSTICSKIRFINPIFDELGKGCFNMGITNYAARIFDVIIQNPRISANTLFRLPSGAWLTHGEVGFQNIDGSATDHRTVVLHGTVNRITTISMDTAIYRTDSPSVKLDLGEVPVPVTRRHYIPCDAGIEKIISVYLRKNGYYGSFTLPFMRLRWIIGTPPNTVSNIQEVTMNNVDDAWQQVSLAITPSVTQAVVMELVFQSANTGAVAWYDDIGVS